eukprot:2679900-Pleurochrysis_carterae.AAC.1
MLRRSATACALSPEYTIKWLAVGRAYPPLFPSPSATLGRHAAALRERRASGAAAINGIATTLLEADAAGLIIRRLLLEQRQNYIFFFNFDLMLL